MKVLVDFDPSQDINTVITYETAHQFIKKLFDLPCGKMIHLSVQKLTEDELRELITSTVEYQREYRRNNKDKCKKYTKTYYQNLSSHLTLFLRTNFYSISYVLQNM